MSYPRASDRARHEEKKKKNREAVRKHRERRRLKYATNVTDSVGAGTSMCGGDSNASDPISASRTIFIATPPSGSNENIAQPQSLMALANAALSEGIKSSPSHDWHLPRDLPQNIHPDSPSSAHMCSVSTQTDTFKFDLSSNIFRPPTRSIAIQTHDFCLGDPDCRLRRCMWPLSSISPP